MFGLGKLGGGELNFSSDIDLIYAFAEHGTSDGARPLAAEEYFTRIGQRLAQLLGDATADLGMALAARAALPGRPAIEARADRAAACERLQQSLPILVDLDQRMGIEKGNLRPEEVRQALQRCG